LAPKLLENTCASVISNVVTERDVKSWPVLSSSFFPSTHVIMIYVELKYA